MTKQLEFIDALVADGQTAFTFAEATKRLNVSPSATANALRQLQQKGLVCRISRGIYAIRPLGALGTSMATEDPSGAVKLAFGERQHRIGYLSALAEFDLLTHPVRSVYVACTSQVRSKSVSWRPLHSVIERPETIHLETWDYGTTKCSTLERALLESALRIDLVGSIERFAEALQGGLEQADASRIAALAVRLGPRGLAAERRLASVAHAMGMTHIAVEPIAGSMIRLDPREPEVEWVDERFRVSWHLGVDELRASVQN